MLRNLSSWWGAKHPELEVNNIFPSFGSQAATQPDDTHRECFALTKRSIGLLLKGDVLAAHECWKHLEEICRANAMSPRDTVGPDVSERTLVEEALVGGDAKVASFLHSRIPSGIYSQGRILRSEKGLFTLRDGKPDGLAFCWVPNGGLYIGGVKGDYFEGKGKISYAYGDVYEGHWSDGHTVGPSSWWAQKGTLAAHLNGTRKRRGDGPACFADTAEGIFYAQR